MSDLNWVQTVCIDYYLCFVFVMLSCLSLQPCGHLLGKGWPLGSLVCDVLCVFVTFLCDILGQVWYLIVSIPDLCLLTYFQHITLVIPKFIF